MKFIGALFLFFISSICFSQQITVNEEETKVTFVFLDQDVTGELSDFNFTGAIDLTSLETATIAGTVATETLDTNNWLRSRHLRGKKYFYAKAFPKLEFKSNRIEAMGDTFRVSGSLTMKGITKDVVWIFSIKGNTLEGTARVNTQDHDIIIYDDRDRNEVAITISMPFTKSN